MSKSALLWVGRHLVVKDNGLFDNLPWNWVMMKNGIVDNNASQAKRDAYDVFFGKDIGLRKFNSWGAGLG